MQPFKALDFKLFGESHSDYIGITIKNLPKGIKLDYELINNELTKRRPNGKTSTKRIELDEYKIISGVTEGITNGEDLTVHIPNKNVRSSDYDQMKNIMRPGHADLVANIKTNGTNDYRGGGKFSGRLTAPLVFMGAICKQILKEKGIYIGSSINRIGLISNKIYQGLIRYDEILTLNKMPFPCLDNNLVDKYEKVILDAAKNNDSVGGLVTTYAIGVPVGLGDAYFDGVESYLSYLIYGIPAVKGVSFGVGEKFSGVLGSSVSDTICYNENKEIIYKYNLNGGINGGITNGAPIVINTTIKPTPTIGIVQDTINIETKENVQVAFGGRHDPCIVQRAYVVIESMVAFGILDLLLEAGK